MSRQSNFENHRIRSLIWIVRKLKQKPMTLDELNDEWLYDTDISGGKAIERRTFRNHLNAISDIFHIEIECDRRDDFRYKITCYDNEPLVENLMNSFEQNMALLQTNAISDYIIVDRPPMGAEHLEKIMEAIEKHRNISFDFHHFTFPEAFTVTGSPYCLRLYQQRWYVVVREDDGTTDTFCLDRISHLRMEKTKFRPDSNFSAANFFRNSFGVRVNTDVAPSLIKLKVLAPQVGYLRTLPLHHSQAETETTPHYSIFTISVVPTTELTMKLLSYGSLVEVLSPASYRQVLKNEVEALHKTYF